MDLHLFNQIRVFLLNGLIEKEFFGCVLQLQVVSKCPDETDDMQGDHRDENYFQVISNEVFYAIHDENR